MVLPVSQYYNPLPDTSLETVKNPLALLRSNIIKSLILVLLFRKMVRAGGLYFYFLRKSNKLKSNQNQIECGLAFVIGYIHFVHVKFNSNV